MGIGDPTNVGMVAGIGRLLQDVRRKRPVIHHITNYVTVNDCANAVLAIGASPIMADDIDEVEEIVSVSSALVLNIGTLNGRTIDSMLAAARKANELSIPVVLDPVGAGASGLRNRTVERLIKEIRVDVLRGNMSEIRFVAGLGAATKGVDVSDADAAVGTEAGGAIAENVAKTLGCVTAITGATDIISDGERTIFVENGTEMLSKVTGTGCVCSSLVGAFCGAARGVDGGPPVAPAGMVDHVMLIAAAGGILSMGVAGEIALHRAGASGPGSFHLGLIDAIGELDAETLARRARIREA